MTDDVRKTGTSFPPFLSICINLGIIVKVIEKQ